MSSITVFCPKESVHVTVGVNVPVALSAIERLPFVVLVAVCSPIFSSIDSHDDPQYVARLLIVTVAVVTFANADGVSSEACEHVSVGGAFSLIFVVISPANGAVLVVPS